MSSGNRVPRPRIERSLQIHLRGDWGRTNLHRICGWLSHELIMLSGPRTRTAIWNGRASLDSMIAVADGEADVALTTPDFFARMVFSGRGTHEYQKYRFPHLRALGCIPHDDRMIVAIRKEFGIRTFNDLRARKPKIRLSIGLDDGIHALGVASMQMMATAGIPRREFESWGGSFREHEEPPEVIHDVTRGNADGLIAEAVMTEHWQKLVKSVELEFIPIEKHVLGKLEESFGWRSAVLPAGYFPGLTFDLDCLDFSNFLLLTSEHLPDDVAYALAWILVERWEGIERQYRHIPPERSPLTYPLKPKEACRTPIPLHPGAERYYRDAGHLT